MAEDLAGAVDPDSLSKNSAVNEAKGDGDDKNEVEMSEK